MRLLLTLTTTAVALAAQLNASPCAVDITNLADCRALASVKGVVSSNGGVSIDDASQARGCTWHQRTNTLFFNTNVNAVATTGASDVLHVCRSFEGRASGTCTSSTPSAAREVCAAAAQKHNGTPRGFLDPSLLMIPTVSIASEVQVESVTTAPAGCYVDGATGSVYFNDREATPQACSDRWPSPICGRCR